MPHCVIEVARRLHRLNDQRCRLQLIHDGVDGAWMRQFQVDGDFMAIQSLIFIVVRFVSVGRSRVAETREGRRFVGRR